MSSRVKEIFDDINSLDDLRKWVSTSKDGESLWLEFKGLRREKKDWGVGAFEKHIKTIIAKAVCAFLNTCDGILCVGVDFDCEKRLFKMNEYEGDLRKFLERAIGGLFEPDAAGVEFKTVEEEIVLIFVPKSEMRPHRVCGDVKEKVVRNYYIRSDTSSKPLPESIVRSLYLSYGRIPNIEVFTNVEIASSNHLILKVFAKPDEAIFVDKYYDYEKFFMLDGGGEQIGYKDNDSLWTDIDSSVLRQNNPIYPSNEPIKLAIHSITNDALDNDDSFLSGLEEDSEYNPMADDTRISIQDYRSLRYIVTESGFACDGVPLRRDRRLFVLPDWLGSEFGGIYSRKNYEFYSNDKLKSIEEKYGLRVFVSSYYDNDSILDSPENEFATAIPGKGQISVSQIDVFLKNKLTIKE